MLSGAALSFADVFLVGLQIPHHVALGVLDGQDCGSGDEPRCASAKSALSLKGRSFSTAALAALVAAVAGLPSTGLACCRRYRQCNAHDQDGG